MEASSPPIGDELLTAVSESMAALHEHYHGRAPASAKTTMLGDDLLACVLDVERLSGRRVESFISTHNVGPDLEIELFFLAPT